MIAIGAILLILGLIFSVPILTYIGVVTLVVGAVFWLLGAAGHAVGGRKGLVPTSPGRAQCRHGHRAQNSTR